MSIIQEALKKAQRKNVAIEIVKKEPVRQDLPEEMPSYIRKPIAKTKNKPEARKPSPRIAFYGIILASVFAVLFIKYYPSKPGKNIDTHAASFTHNLMDQAESAQASPVPTAVRTQNIEPAREIKRLIRQGDFRLSGIMDLEDGRRAIINNLVVVEGDSIGSVKIETITTNSVTLKRGEESLTLQLK